MDGPKLTAMARNTQLTHPLDGVGAKVMRSEANYQSLNKDAASWLSARAGGHVVTAVKRVDDPELGDISFFAENVPETPAWRWGTILGDVIHNLRSALDHLAFALADVNAPDRGDDRITLFPITQDKTDFDSKRRRLKFVSDRHVEMIEREQPWQRNDPSTVADHPLSLLEELDNADKHRVLRVVALGFDLWSYHPVEGLLALTNATITHHVIYEEPLVRGARLMTVRIAKVDPNGPEPNVEMKPVAAAPNLTIGSGLPLKNIVPNLNGCVRGVVERFAGEFQLK